MPNYDAKAVLAEANQAAYDAVVAASHLEGRGGLDCGFAWVHVAKAREAVCRLGQGRKHHKAGWVFWMPGRAAYPSAQSVGVFQPGARAFAAVLQKHGIDCYADSRLD